MQSDVVIRGGHHSGAVALQLTRMPGSAVDAYLEEVRRRFAQDAVDAGLWEPQEAAAHAVRSVDRLVEARDEGCENAFLEGRTSDLDIGSAPMIRAWLSFRASPRGVVALLADFVVMPEHRGRGLGQAAMGLVAEYAAACNAIRVEVNTFGANTAIARLIARSGYRPLYAAHALDVRNFAPSSGQATSGHR